MARPWNCMVEGISGETFTQKDFRGINPFGVADSRTFEARRCAGQSRWRPDLKPGFFVQASIPSAKEKKTMFLQAAGGELRYGRLQRVMVSGNRVSERHSRPAGAKNEDRARQSL